MLWLCFWHTVSSLNATALVTNPSGRSAWEDASVRCWCSSHCWWCVGTQLFWCPEGPRGLPRAHTIRWQLRQRHIALRRVETWATDITHKDLPAVLYICTYRVCKCNVIVFSSQVYRLKKWEALFLSQEETQREETHSQCPSDSESDIILQLCDLVSAYEQFRIVYLLLKSYE